MGPALAVVVLSLLVLPCLGQGRASPGLEAYVGKNLRLLDANILMLQGRSSGPNARVFFQRFDALTGDKPDPKGGWGPYGPWWVNRFKSGRAAWMVLEAYPGYDNPDTSAVRVHVFDRHWKRFVRQAFPTGSDLVLAGAKVSRNGPLDQDLLVTTTDQNGFYINGKGEWRPASEQGHYLRQYYALLGDQLILVRIEDHQGRSVRNLYEWSAPNIGPPVPKQTPDQWIRSLRSTDRVAQLAALVWLTGYHLSSKEPRYKNVNQESPEDSRMFEAVRDSPETKEALSQMRNSKNRWVREYAQLGLRPPDE